MNISTGNAPVRFSSLELQALSALIDPAPLYGITAEDAPAPAPDQETAAKQYAQILEGLAEKNILDAQNRFTPDGVRLIETLRGYKQANEYIFINEIRLSKNRDASVTLIVKQPDGAYSFLRTWPHIFMEALAAKMPWLNRQDPHPPSDPVTYLHEDDWIEELIDYSMNRPNLPESAVKDILIVRQHRAESPEPLTSLIYYRKNNATHLYNQHTRQQRILSGQDIRHGLQDLLAYAKVKDKTLH